MANGIVIYYYSYFSSEFLFHCENDIHIDKISSWSYIDESFNDYFINIFSINSQVKSLPSNIIDPKIFNYSDEISNCIFTFETKMKYKNYKYLNVIKCGYEFNKLIFLIFNKFLILFF